MVLTRLHAYQAHCMNDSYNAIFTPHLETNMYEAWMRSAEIGILARTEPIKRTRTKTAEGIPVRSTIWMGNNVNHRAALPYHQYSPLEFPKAARTHLAAAKIPLITAHRPNERQTRRVPQAENSSTGKDGEEDDP